MSPKDPIRVGVLFSETGATSTIGRSQLQGTLLAIEEINEQGGVDGREIVPIYYDCQSQPAIYAALAEHLLTRDRVNVIFGCYMSSSRKAVIPVVEKWNKLLFYPTLYEGFEFSTNLVYTGAAPNQNSVQLAEFMTSKYGPRAYLIGSDYIYPYESNRIMRELVLQRRRQRDTGRTVCLARCEPARLRADHGAHPRLPPRLHLLHRRRRLDGGPLPGLRRCRLRCQRHAHREPDDVGGGNRPDGARPRGGPLHVGAVLPVDPLGQRTCAAWSACGASFGEACVPNLCWEAAYYQVHLFAAAFASAGSDEIARIMPHLLGSEFQAPQGRVRIDASNHHTWLYPRIGRAEADGQFSIVREAAPGCPTRSLPRHSFAGRLDCPSCRSDSRPSEGPFLQR